MYNCSKSPWIKVKRVIDILASGSGIIILFPAFVIIGILILINIGYPIIFKQQRPGLNAKTFRVYKFRTMSEKKDFEGNLLPDSMRLTKLGKLIRKLSLDELPQLWNVFKGDMSFIGPRPLLVEYLPLYNERQARRHDVRPGITGWAQVNGRNAISWEEKFELDVWYVENQSFLLDCKILWMTVVKVFKSEGINQVGEATMTKFTGSSTEKTKGDTL